MFCRDWHVLFFFKQSPDFLDGEMIQEGAARFDHLVDQAALAILQLQDLFFDAAACDQPDDLDRMLLAHAMCPVGCLVFHGRIPPWVVMDDRVRTGQVQTGAARAQGNQENAPFAGVEGIDQIEPVFDGGPSVESDRKSVV